MFFSILTLGKWVNLIDLMLNEAKSKDIYENKKNTPGSCTQYRMFESEVRHT